MNDIKPLPKPERRENDIKPLDVAISKDWEQTIMNQPQGFEDWFSRALALRLRAVNIPLYRLNGSEYEKLELEG